MENIFKNEKQLNDSMGNEQITASIVIPVQNEEAAISEVIVDIKKEKDKFS